MKLDTPRTLTTTESAIIGFLLPPQLPDAEELRSQLDQAMVVGKCDCGCPTIDISIPTTATPSIAYVGRAPLPYEGVVNDYPGAGIILFAEGGYLSSLEYYFSDDEVPEAWPPMGKIQLEGPFER
jgi:hypothetical protein